MRQVTFSVGGGAPTRCARIRSVLVAWLADSRIGTLRVAQPVAAARARSAPDDDTGNATGRVVAAS
jgi:hypothetical protein